MNSRGDELNSLLVQTARLSNDVADLLRNNKDFIDKSFAGGQDVLNVLYDHQNDVVPLIIGLREYVQSLAKITRLDVGDGTLMAAVKSITCPAPNIFQCNSSSAAAGTSSTTGSGSPTAGPSSTGAPPAQPSSIEQLLAQLAQLGVS